MRNKEGRFVFYSGMFQILVLILSSFSIAFIISNEVGVVSAAPGPAGLGALKPNTPILSDPMTSSDEFLAKYAEGDIVTKTGEAGGVSNLGADKVASPTFMDRIFGGQMFGTESVGATAGGALLSGLVWGGVVYGAVKLLGGLFGLDEGVTNAVALGGFAGVATWKTLSLASSTSATNPALSAGWGAAAPWIGLGVGVAVFLATYKKEKKEIVRFECLPWQPPTGGENCERCNEDPLIPCSEYRCKSLGQACEIVNKGTTEESCVWVSKFDVEAPIIKLDQNALKPAGLQYIPDNAINPPNQGVKIIRNGARKNCLEAFTKLQFGITTDEPAQCRIDIEMKENFDDYSFAFGSSSLYKMNHTQLIPIADPFNEEGNSSVIDSIHNKGTYNLYTKCRDANGNENEGTFAFSFCVDDGPDVKQPIVVGSSITSGSPVRNNVDKVPIEFYVNEPAECKWSRQDKAFDSMENAMQCSREIYEINAELNYVCQGELTGIKNLEDNGFFVRCKDRKGNIMSVSYPITLRGTEALTIKEVGPSGTIKAGGGTSVGFVTLEVETSNGANNGESKCFFSNVKEGDNPAIEMLGSDTPYHNQTLDLEAGNYEVFFRCIDKGGNVAESNTSFSVIVDSNPPRISRVYRDESSLKIVTDEEAKCSYSTTSCDYIFESGLPLVYEDVSEKIVHYTEWDFSKTYYIKCADLQDNRPRSATCQLIAKGSEF